MLCLFLADLPASHVWWHRSFFFYLFRAHGENQQESSRWMQGQERRHHRESLVASSNLAEFWFPCWVVFQIFGCNIYIYIHICVCGTWWALVGGSLICMKSYLCLDGKSSSRLDAFPSKGFSKPPFRNWVFPYDFPKFPKLKGTPCLILGFPRRTVRTSSRPAMSAPTLRWRPDSACGSNTGMLPCNRDGWRPTICWATWLKKVLTVKPCSPQARSPVKAVVSLGRITSIYST